LLNPEGPPSVFEPLMAERRARTTWCKTADALGVVTTRIGKLWESGDIDVLDEHLATTRLERAVARCTEAIKMPAGAPTCLLVTAPGEDHTLGLTLVEPCLREAGWHTQWAGRRTPIVPIMDRIEDGSIQGVAASASAYSTDGIALASFADHIGEVCQRNGVALWLGGTGAWPDRLAYGHRLSSFVELDALARPASERHRAERYPTT
jgi:methanogenic corrinoid protein MtbC1